MSETARKQALIAYAQAYQLESQVWQVASDRDAFEAESYREERDRLTRLREQAMTDYVEAGGVIFDRMITGYAEGVDHYDIDDALREQFENRVNPDSESSELFVYLSSVDEKDILEFLNRHYPTLKYRATDMTEQEIPGIGNWPAAREFLRKLGIEPITRDYSYIVPERTEGEIDELVNEAVDTLGKTGLNHAQVMVRFVKAWSAKKLPMAATLEDLSEDQS